MVVTDFAMDIKMGTNLTFLLLLVPMVAFPCAANLMSGPESCDYCVQGMTAFGEFAQGDLAGDRQLAVLTDTFCLNTTDPAGCGENIAQFWPKVVSALASYDFIPILVCQELMACVHANHREIPTSTPAGNWNCGTCQQDVDKLGNLMQDDYPGGTVDTVKGYLKDFLYCKNGEVNNVGECVSMVEDYFAQAMAALGQTVIQFDYNICRDAYNVCG